MKSFHILIIIFIFQIFNIKPVLAIYDPLTVPNNKFGIHIIDENDIENAADLVNSSGGDWGYVTIVIPDNDLNYIKWQNILDKLTQKHLIPLIRIATHIENGVWVKPTYADTDKWESFLNNLYWTVKNRYIIIFNEPNHSKEWSNSINPEEYAKTVKYFSTKFKSLSKDYFILGAGLDASAPNGKLTMNESDFLVSMLKSEPDFFKFIDGWVSHSYPNPGFIGNPKDTGKGTLKTYKWEIDYLKTLGLNNNLPIFITETGWPHQEGNNRVSQYYNETKISEKLEIALAEIWSDPQIAAVTPFVLNYQSYPFDNFSWQKQNSNEFYQYYYIYNNYPKVRGKPLLNLTEYNPISIPFDQEQKGSSLRNNIKSRLLSIRRFFLDFVSNLRSTII